MARGKRADIEKRRRAVRQLLEMQYSMAQTVERLCGAAEGQFDVAPKTIEADFTIVWKQIQREEDWNKPNRKEQMRATIRAGLQRAIARKDSRAEALFIDRLCKLDGLYAPVDVRTEHTGVVGLGVTVDLSKMKSVDRRRRLDELMAKARADFEARRSQPEDPAGGNGHGNGSNGNGKHAVS